MVFHSFICGNITPGDARNTDLLVRFDWMWFCFNVCWPGKQDGMVCIAKVSRSNTSFQKVKYLSSIYNSSKIIRSNKFYFQKARYMFELTCPSGSYDEENYLNVYASCLPYCIFDLSIRSINKEYFTHFLKCHDKTWFRPPTQAYVRQCEHRRHEPRLSNASCHTTQAALKGGEEEIKRASNSGWSESYAFL